MTVAGTLAPDATGIYPKAGTFGGRTYYHKAGTHWSLWKQPVNPGWTIANCDPTGSTLYQPYWWTYDDPETAPLLWTPANTATGQAHTTPDVH